MDTDRKGLLVTGEQLAAGPGFRACVMSFFDGMLDHHRELLTYGADLCDGDRSHLLVILCTVDRQGPLPPKASPAFLSPDECLQMLNSMGYHHIMPWIVSPSCSTYEVPRWPVDPGLLQKKTGVLVPGADIWDNTLFGQLLQKGTQESALPASHVDGTFHGKDTGGHGALVNLIGEGRVEEALQCMGYAFPLGGHVVEGNKIGRTIGYPTANLRVADHLKVLPGQGVYAALVNSRQNWYRGMINIGIRPTLDMENVTIEAHLFDFEEDIYGQWISISFLARIRDEMRFNSLTELKLQLNRDSSKAKEVLEKHDPGTVTGKFVTAGIKSS